MRIRKESAAGNAGVSTGPGPTREVVAKVAELLWEKAGRPKGRDMEFWLLAKAILQDANPSSHHETET